VVTYEFEDYFLHLLKNVTGTLIEICIDSVDCVGWCEHFNNINSFSP
jgi:hypothetical protein